MGFVKKWRKRKRKEKEAQERIMNNFAFKQNNEDKKSENIEIIQEDTSVVEHSNKIPMEEQPEEIEVTPVEIPEEINSESENDASRTDNKIKDSEVSSNNTKTTVQEIIEDISGEIIIESENNHQEEDSEVIIDNNTGTVIDSEAAVQKIPEYIIPNTDIKQESQNIDLEDHILDNENNEHISITQKFE